MALAPMQAHPTKGLQKRINRAAEPTKLKGETSEIKNLLGSEV